MTQQLAFLLQQAGAVSIHEVEKALEHSQDVDSTPLQVLLSSGTLSYAALQEVLLYYGHTPATLPAATVPRLTEQEAFARETAGVPSAFDEYSTTDQQLQAFLLERGTLTQAHIDQALEEQRLTGHPLWRTLINLQLLAPQDMREIIQSLGRVTPGDDAEPEEPGQERASNGKQTDLQRVPWRLLPVGRHTTAVELVDTIFNGAVHADATDIHLGEGAVQKISPVPPARDDPCTKHCGKPDRSCRIKVDAILARDMVIIFGPTQRTPAVGKGETTMRQIMKPP